MGLNREGDYIKFLLGKGDLTERGLKARGINRVFTVFNFN